MILRNRGKCLKRWNVGSEASMASTMGALKSGSSIACTDLAKQKLMIVSTVKHRNANSRSADLPAASFLAITSTR